MGRSNMRQVWSARGYVNAKEMDDLSVDLQGAVFLHENEAHKFNGDGLGAKAIAIPAAAK